MNPRNIIRPAALALALTAVFASAFAQQTVYKWVDEDGVVHFSDAPPPETRPADTESFTTARPPADAAAAQPAAGAAATVHASARSGEPATPQATPQEPTDLAGMSLADLDRRCDEAREAKLAPLREVEIVQCKQDKRNDPAWCERFNADFGDAGRTASGAMRPRMFDDLPECVEALQERNRRGR